MTNVELPRTIATTYTANGTLVAGTHTPVDATTGSITVNLPSPTHVGASLSVEKRDASTNAVIISGSIRGPLGSISLVWQFETVTLRWSGATWIPTEGHKTKASLDAAYAQSAPEYASVAALKAARPADGAVAKTSGYRTPGDGGGAVYVYSASSVATDDGGSVHTPNVGGGRWLLQNTGLPVPVMAFGANTGQTGATNVNAINNAISYVSGLNDGGLVGGTVQLPVTGKQLFINAPIIARPNVTLSGVPWGTRAKGGMGSRIYCDSSFTGTAMLMDSAVPATGFTVTGVGFYYFGDATSGTVEAIYFTQSLVATFVNLGFNNIPRRAIYLAAGASVAQIYGVAISDALRNSAWVASNGVPVGAVEVHGVDSTLADCELTVGGNGLNNPSNLYAASCLWACDKGRIHNSIFQLGDIGLNLTGNDNTVSLIRCDRNWGHGLVVSGANNMISTSNSISNSKGLTQTYSGVSVTGYANHFTAYESFWDQGTDPAQQHKYAFSDSTVFGSTQKNVYVACRGAGGSSANWALNNGAIGNAPQVSFPDGGWEIFTANGSITLGGYTNNIQFTNTTAQNVTRFFNVFDGHTMHILGDGFTTLVHQTTGSYSPTTPQFVLKAAANTLLAANKVYNFLVVGQQLIEI